jgi:hypothetical protein
VVEHAPKGCVDVIGVLQDFFFGERDAQVVDMLQVALKC